MRDNRERGEFIQSDANTLQNISLVTQTKINNFSQ